MPTHKSARAYGGNSAISLYPIAYESDRNIRLRPSSCYDASGETGGIARSRSIASRMKETSGHLAPSSCSGAAGAAGAAADRRAAAARRGRRRRRGARRPRRGAARSPPARPSPPRPLCTSCTPGNANI